MSDSLLAELEAQLRRSHSDLRVEHTGDCLNVGAPVSTGFAVGLDCARGAWVVTFGDWHHECSEAAEALEYFRRGVIGAARLVVTSRGGTAYRWQAELLEGSEWRPDWRMGTFFFPFWRKKEQSILRNPQRAWIP